MLLLTYDDTKGATVVMSVCNHILQSILYVSTYTYFNVRGYEYAWSQCAARLMSTLLHSPSPLDNLMWGWSGSPVPQGKHWHICSQLRGHLLANAQIICTYRGP